MNEGQNGDPLNDGQNGGLLNEGQSLKKSSLLFRSKIGIFGFFKRLYEESFEFFQIVIENFQLVHYVP